MELEKNVVPSRNNEHTGLALITRIPSKKYSNVPNIPYYYIPDNSIKISIDLRRLEKEQRKLLQKWEAEEALLPPAERKALATEIRCKSIEKISLLKSFISLNELALAATFDLFAEGSLLPSYEENYDEIGTQFSAMASLKSCLIEAEKLRKNKMVDEYRHSLPEGAADLTTEDINKIVRQKYNAEENFNNYCYCLKEKPIEKGEFINIACTVCQSMDPLDRVWYHNTCVGFRATTSLVYEKTSFICPSCWIKGRIPETITYLQEGNDEPVSISKETLIENYEQNSLNGWKAFYNSIGLYDKEFARKMMEKSFPSGKPIKKLLEDPTIPKIEDESHPFVVEKRYKEMVSDDTSK